MAQSYAKRLQQKMYSEEKTKWAWKKWEKTPQRGFWQTQEMAHVFICLKISIIQKGGKIFNTHFLLLTSFFFVWFWK